MLRVTLKNLAGRKLRLALTALAVVLGVAFVAGTFVLTDSIKSTFDALTAQAAKNVAVTVRGEEGLTDPSTGDASSAGIPLTLVDQLAKVDGVRQVTPEISGNATLKGTNGAVRSGGAPTLGFAIDPADDTFVLENGRWATNADEVTVETKTLERSGLKVGDRTAVVAGAGTVSQVQIVGSADFGNGVGLAGATVVLFDADTARKLFSPDGTVARIDLKADDGVSQATLRDRVQATLPAGLQAVTGQQQADEDKEAVTSGLNFINIILLVFAGISLFVGAFIIANTFSMLVAQRTRELALLRVLGASRRQVNRSVLVDAFVVGLIGSVVGLFLGLGIAALLKVLLGRVGLEITAALPIRPRTIIVAFVVGISVTVLASVFPALRASRIPPIAAMTDVDTTEKGVKLRTSLGALLAVAGGVSLGFGLAASGKASGVLSGLGAVGLFLGVTMLAPVLAGPVIAVMGWPYRKLFGTMGVLAKENAARSPRRTATTASALMIGLALVSGVTILAASIKETTSGVVDQKVTADFVLSGGNSLMPPGVGTAVARLPEVASIARIAPVSMRIGDQDTTAIAVDAKGLSDSIAVDMTAGTLTALDAGQLLVDDDLATQRGWQVGTALTADVGTLKAQRVTVGGIYQKNALLSGIVAPQALYDRAVPTTSRGDFNVLVRTKPGTDPAADRKALAAAVDPFLVVSVQDREEFKSQVSQQVNTILGIIYGLLALAVIIAIFGIINTLALSVFERTREIGLLRAIGLTRRQLRRVIRLESIIIALFGGLLGTVLGVVLAVMLQKSLADDGIDQLSVPVVQLLLFLVFAILVGVLAAWWPSRRAAKLDVLRAVTSD